MARRAVKSGRRSLCTANSLSVLIYCRYLLEGFVWSVVGCPHQERLPWWTVPLQSGKCDRDGIIHVFKIRYYPPFAAMTSAVRRSSFLVEKSTGSSRHMSEGLSWPCKMISGNHDSTSQH
jgi:hypothetical protein